MAILWLSFLVGIRIRDCSWTVQEWLSDSASGLDYLADSAGAGTTGDTTGTTAGEWNSTTTRTFRIAEPSLIGIVSMQHEGALIMSPIPEAEVSGAMKDLPHTHRQECIPALSAGSIMAGM